MKLVGLVALVGVIAILYAQFFALWDVLARQPELALGLRIVWLLALLAFPVLGAIAYLRMGPGQSHWMQWGSADEE